MVISKIRSDHDVQINFPRKDEEEHIITITGYEKNAYSARDDIMKIVNELVSQFYRIFFLCFNEYPFKQRTIHTTILNHIETKYHSSFFRSSYFRPPRNNLT